MWGRFLYCDYLTFGKYLWRQEFRFVRFVKNPDLSDLSRIQICQQATFQYIWTVPLLKQSNRSTGQHPTTPNKVAGKQYSRISYDCEVSNNSDKTSQLMIHTNTYTKQLLQQAAPSQPPNKVLPNHSAHCHFPTEDPPDCQKNSQQPLLCWSMKKSDKHGKKSYRCQIAIDQKNCSL